MTSTKRRLSIIGQVLIAGGMLLLAVYAGAHVHRFFASRAALREFERAKALSSKPGPKPAGTLDSEIPVDFALWSRERVRAYYDSRKAKKGEVVAVLSFARWKLRVPVFEGTDEWTLNRGAGWILGTARLGELGNIGIAGHRDGFFRPLKDIAVGDPIELSTATSAATYAVDAIDIVTPQDVHVLRQRSAPSLTLVTCYPFYFVGEAPRRFIVRAALKHGVLTDGTQEHE
jgi:sortase A